MPEDFFKFYEFCCTLSEDDPTMALRVVELELVGPFDVLAGKIKNVKGDKDVYLRHWRYFYDPPELQVIFFLISFGFVEFNLHFLNLI